MDSHYQKTLNALGRHVSPATARALLTRSLKEQGLTPNSLSTGDLVRMSTALRRGVRLFVDSKNRDEADRDLSAYLGGDVELPSAVSLSILEEHDVVKVRAEARRLCSTCGATPFSMQKIATVVSELARNIVLYAGQGELSLTPKRGQGSNGSQTTIYICAKDNGPGIPNLDLILSGKYRSKTGLGRGLLGTKRLAEQFDISTGRTGTTITAEIAL